jgi:hypothetical protein
MLAWHTFSFEIDDNGGKAHAKESDLAIIDLCLRRVIDKYQDKLTLWRFHRRWTPGAQRLHLHAFTTRDTASEIKAFIQTSAVVKSFRAIGFLKVDPVWDEETILDIELITTRRGKSDSNWPDEFQECWPDFAQGCSQSLAVLIRQYSNTPEADLERMKPDELAGHHRQVEALLMARWDKWGSHAFFHHVHALFGYEPMTIKVVDGRQYPVAVPIVWIA